MKVTKVWFNKFESNAMLGFADVSFSLDGSDAVHMTWKGIKLFKGKNGMFVGMPAEKDKKGATDDAGNPKWWPVIAFAKEEDGPHKDLINQITAAVIEKYESSKKVKPKAPSESTGSSKKTSPTIDNDDDGDGLPF